MSIRLMYRLFLDAGIAFLFSAGPVIAAVYVTAFTANVAQVGFQFTTEPLKFKPDKINPISGFKRMFSAKNLFNLIKSIIKVVIVGFIAYSYVNDRLSDLMTLMGADIKIIIRMGFDMLFDLAFRICAAMLILALVDYAWQWWQHEQDLKMTKQEIKEEYKQMEGDPKIKSKIKEKQRKISMQRMMSSVPQADVVITNPTHYAIAVKYDLAIADAPIVLAKGQDYVALRIRKLAEENNVTIVENKPLARALYDSVEIGEKIPIELYHAVAEVLAFVYNLKNKKIA
jgi:flagellar biosynthetic protein FlhB